MPQFHFSAQAPDGRTTSGDIEAPSRLDAVRLIQARGLRPLSVAAGAKGALWTLLNRDLGSMGHGRRSAIIAFTREFAVLLAARINPAEALDILGSSAPDEQKGIPTPAIIRAVRGGATLADALAEHPQLFDTEYVGLVRVGQASGALPAVMQQLADSLERRAAMRDRVAGALIYPSLLVATSIATIALLVTVVLPSFEPMFRRAGAALPWPTRVVLALSDGVSRFGGVALILGVLAGVTLWLSMRDPVWRLAFDRRLIRLALVGELATLSECARAFRALATMVTGGLGLRPSLALVADGCRNRAIRAELLTACAAIDRGGRLSEALGSSRDLPPVVARMIRVGEESGTLPSVLERLAAIMESKLDQKLSRLVSMLTPLLTLVVGGIIALILFAILSAVLSANDLVLQS